MHGWGDTNNSWAIVKVLSWVMRKSAESAVDGLSRGCVRRETDTCIVRRKTDTCGVGRETVTCGVMRQTVTCGVWSSGLQHRKRAAQGGA